MKIKTKYKNYLNRFIFHPATILVCAAVATILFTILAARYGNFSGAFRYVLYFYHAPIGFAFVIYLFDRAQHWRTFRLAQVGISLLVIAAALARAVKPVPFYSGHALFITYMLLTVSSKLARVVAVAILIEVALIKVFVLHDPTVWGGIVLGLIAFAAQKKLVKSAPTEPVTLVQ